MLAAPNRLRSGRTISRVMARGRYGVSDSLTIKTMSNGNDHSRAVVVVSKKVSKKATVRNRIRRQLAAQLAGSWATVKPGYDIVVTVRAGRPEATAAELKAQLKTALERAQLLGS